MKIYFLFVLILFQIYFANCQVWDYSYTKYTKSDGLPSNTVYSVCSDKNGIMWIGTNAGLCRFDGTKITIFTTADGLPNNDVFQVYCDSKNTIWIKTMGKDVCYCKNNKIFCKSNSSILNKLKTQTKIVAIFEDSESSIWIISYPFILNRIRNDSVEIFDFSQTDNSCFNYTLQEEGIYFFTRMDTYFYGYRTNVFTKSITKCQKKIVGFQQIGNKCYFLDSNYTIQRDNISTLGKGTYCTNIDYWTLFQSNNILWQLSNHGILSINPNSKSEPKLFLKDYSVSNFIQDQEMNIWISTLNNGLFRLNSKKVRNFRPHIEEYSNAIHSVLVNQDQIVVGNDNGLVSLISKKDYNLVKKINLNLNSKLSIRILKLIHDNDDLILSTDVGVCRYNFKSDTLKLITGNLATKNMFHIEDTLIVLTNTSVEYYSKDALKIKSFILNDRFYSHTIYNNYKLFGSENALYYENKSLIKYPLDQPFHYRLMDMKVMDSMLVIATTEKGVFFINQHKIVRNLNLSSGLNSNNCAKVVPYKNDLVIATNNGICIYNYKLNTFDKIMESDGLASNNVLDIVIDKDTIYAGTDNGLSIIPIEGLKFRKTFSFFVSPIFINKDTLWDIKRTISAKSDFPISLTLNAISLGVKGNVQYYYRICEIDSSYFLTTDQNIKLGMLKPGIYTFEAYATDVNSIESKHALLRIIIVPYWWQTSFFKWCCAILILLTIAGLIKLLSVMIRRREEKRNEEANRTKKLELDAWKSNINPHFLFNSFNTMQSLFSSSKFEKANEFVASFSSLLRKTIDNSSKLLNTFDEERAYLLSYLALEKTKKNDRLDYSITMSDGIEDFYIPSLLIQPIIENSIKHGIKPLKTAEILVEFKLMNSYIKCTILDNGIGLPNGDFDYTNSKGLRLVRDKIRIVENITKQKIEFTLENVYDADRQCTGVLATFILPILNSNNYEVDEQKSPIDEE